MRALSLALGDRDSPFPTSCKEEKKSEIVGNTVSFSTVREHGEHQLHGKEGFLSNSGFWGD